MVGTCRLSGQPLSAPLFRSLACARCLLYIYFVTPPFSDRYVVDVCNAGLLVCDRLQPGPCSCTETPERVFNIPEYSLNRSQSRPLEYLQLQPELPPDYVLITQQCCEAAFKCCENVLAFDHEHVVARKTSYSVSRESVKREPKSLALNLDSPVSCPATWDGWQCFERSAPGTVERRCPNYIFGDRLRNDMDPGFATKECEETGDWLKRYREQEAIEWTDYSGCVVSQLTFKMIAGIIAFSITVISIVPAIIIFTRHSALKSQTVFRIHTNLLASFLFSGLFYLFNCFFFVIDGAVGDHLYFVNHISCRILFTLQLRYFRLSTFTWMLGEGVHLFRLLWSTYSSDNESLKPYYIFCWGFPLVMTVIYSMLRQFFDNEECWVSPSKIFWIEWTIIGPCLIALCINLVLVLIVLCVLINKLRYNPHYEPMQYTKAVRAVFMLMPVFGLHFLLTIYRIPSYVHQIVNLVLDGIQGFLVVLIVCYTNRIVIECMRKWIGLQLDERKLRRQSADKRIQFKRSIENSYATEKLLVAINHKQPPGGPANGNGGNNNTESPVYRANNNPLPGDSSDERLDQAASSGDSSGSPATPPIAVATINGSTVMTTPKYSVNFV